VKRIFWAALGLGAGVTGAVMTSRWLRKKRETVSPAHIAREAKGGVMDLSRLLAESIAEGKRAMDQKEAELTGKPPVD